MEDDYNDSQDSMNDPHRNNSDGNESVGDVPKEFSEGFGNYDENFDEEEGGNSFRGGRGNRGNFRWETWNSVGTVNRDKFWHHLV